MKLKLVVATMSVLGLISFTVLADTDTTTTTTTTSHHAHKTKAHKNKKFSKHAAKSKHKTTKHHAHENTSKTKHHKPVKTIHHIQKAHIVTHADAAPIMPAPVVRPAQPIKPVAMQSAAPLANAAPEVDEEETTEDAMEAIPRLDTYQVTMDTMSQNARRGHAGPDWFNHILINGGMNVDAAWGNRAMGYMGENPRRVSVNDAYLNATALVNNWTKAFTSLSFGDPYPADVTAVVKKLGAYSNAYTDNQLDLEQGYVTFGNFDCTPFFAQIGKQFQPFGKYQIHPIQRTMSQVLSESLQTSAEVGFVTKFGLSGFIYSFDNTLIRSTYGHTQPVAGFGLDLNQPSEDISYDIGIGYMTNMTGINDVAAAITNYQSATIANGTNTIPTAGTYQATVGAINVYADIGSGPFSIGGHYTSALSNFATTTLSNNFNNTDGSVAQPWALDLTANYAFSLWCKKHDVYLGYQASNNAVNIALPRNRWILGYEITVLKNANLGVQWSHDTDYSFGNGGTGITSNTLNARASVQFG